MPRLSMLAGILSGRNAVLLGAAAVAEAAFVALALRSGAPRAELVAWCGAAFLAYGVAAVAVIRAPIAPAPALVLGVAILFRLTLLPAAPAFSDDLYRYLWDGRVQAAGVNPFLHPPAADAVAGIDDALRARVNHPEVPTIYPPLSQVVFLAVASVAPAVMVWKLVITLFEFAAVLLVWRLGRRLRRSTAVLLWYAWNPLAVIEVSGNGHNDPIGVSLLLAAVALILLQRSRMSMAAMASLGASVAAKIATLSLAPLFLFGEGNGRRWRSIPVRAAIFIAVPALLWLPYSGAGSSLWTGLRTYADRWRGNDFVFAGVYRVWVWIDPAPRLKLALSTVWPGAGDTPLLQFLYRHVHPVDCAKATLALILAAVMIDLLRRRDPLPHRVFLWLGWCLLLAPVLHPWYLLWILPFAALYGSPAWLVFTGLVYLSYLPGAADPTGITPIRLLEYLPFFALLWLGHLKRWGLGKGLSAQGTGGTVPEPEPVDALE